MFNILSLLIGVFYIALGVFVMVKKFFVVTLDGIIPYLLGGVLIIYGVFRIIRAINFLRKKDE